MSLTFDKDPDYERKLQRKNRLVDLLKPLRWDEHGNTIRSTYKLAKLFGLSQAGVQGWYVRDSSLPAAKSMKRIAQVVGQFRDGKSWTYDELDHYLETGELPNIQQAPLSVEQIVAEIPKLSKSDVARIMNVCASVLSQTGSDSQSQQG